jgi:hypothetical protein
LPIDQEEFPYGAEVGAAVAGLERGHPDGLTPQKHYAKHLKIKPYDSETDSPLNIPGEGEEHLPYRLGEQAMPTDLGM